LTDLGVTAHEVPLLLVQGTALIENSSGNARLPYIMQQGGKTDLEDLFF